MKKIDFINLLTTYASHFRDKFRKKNVDKILSDFINYVASNQGVDYGINSEDLEAHKRREYNPSDSDVIINMSKKISEYERVMQTLYMNCYDYTQARALIEHMAEKYSGELGWYIKCQIEGQREIDKILAEELKKFIEHPEKPGYKRNDILIRIKELEADKL
jgi:hypothetical protein